MAPDRVRDYRFARRPIWVAAHVAILALVVVLVNLGLWQLRRLDERRDANARVEQRSPAAPAPVAELAEQPAAAVEFRRVRATGTFDASHEVLVGYRTSRGLPGYHVVTPLALEDGTAVLVNRGFVPLSLADEWPVADAAPPPGEVTVVGVLRRSRDARTDRIDDDGEVPVLSETDVAVIDAWVPADVLPMSVELQEPNTAGFPEPLPELDLGEGPHRSYAVQWFLFASVAGIGWLVLLHRRATTALG